MRYLFIICLLFACVSQAQAKEKRYQINLIIFKRFNIAKLEPEQTVKMFDLSTIKHPIALKSPLDSEKVHILQASLNDPSSTSMNQIDDGKDIIDTAAKKISNPLHATLSPNNPSCNQKGICKPPISDFEELSQDQSAFVEINKQFKGHFIILANLSWLQTFPAKKHGPIIIQAGSQFTHNGELIDLSKPQNISIEQLIQHDLTQVDPDTSNEKITPLINEVTGTLSINLNRYFNVKTNLQLIEPVHFEEDSDEANNSEGLTAFKIFSLNETRRMRVGELNYLDNPAFGVLIKVTNVA